jgi:hypothetical protein
MSDLDQLIARYVATWNDTDAAHRLAEIQAVWEADGQYVDPINDVRGAEQLNDAIGGFQTQFPGVVFRLVGPIDAHHAHARFNWAFGPEGGDPIVTGTDVLVHTANGRLSSVVGFFDSAS